MISKILLKNKKLVDNLIDLLLFSFNAYIQVVDLEFEQVSGGGRNAEHAMIEEPIYKAVLAEKNDIHLFNPRRHFVCNSCAENMRCLRKLELAFPIKVDGAICGVLGVFCHSADQRSSVYLDIDSSLDQIKNALAILEAALGSAVEAERKERHVELYRSAATENGKFFIEFDNGDNVIHANAEFLKHLEKELPFSVEMDMLSDGIYNMKVDEKEITVKGEFLSREGSSVFLFNIVNEEIVLKSVVQSDEGEKTPEIIGESEEINRLRSLAMKSAKTNSVIFISGKPGCGKENIARYIHSGSLRKDGLFVKLNCADFDKASIYKTLYGSKESGEIGRVFIADKGVLYLQNADFMPKQLLADLVKYIRSGRVVFDDFSSMSVDVRLIFSSKNENLITELAGFLRPPSGIIPVYVPPVYKIISDLGHYVRYFTNAYQNKDIVDIILSDDIISLLQSYSWPGNLTELRAIVRQIADYNEQFSNVDGETVSRMLSSSFTAYNPDSGKSIKDIENNHISMVVMKYGASVYEKQLAADELGIGIATLYRKIGYKNI